MILHRGAALAIVVGGVLAPAPARAQSICANFWAQQTGTFGDLCGLTVTGMPTTPPPQGTAFGVTGFLVPAGGSFRYAYNSLSQVARFDIQVVGVDPGEEVGFELDGASLTILPEHLIRNPDVTTQTVNLVGGKLRSTGADGSAYLEITALGTLSYRVTVTGGPVIIYTVTNTFCQCGNGNKHFNEDCDDGAFVDGDGCSATCVVETGWTCTGNPSACTLGVCGDGGLGGTEVCDDMNVADGDGCSAACTVEAGWVCSGTPSTCTFLCGNAALDGVETCDDGNVAADDGCDPVCQEQAGWICTGVGPGSCVREPDADGDTVPDAVDICPDVYDPDQADGDADGVGDACDDCVGPNAACETGGGGGCCGTGREHGPGAAVLALAVVAVSRRRRR